jgi:hypothetical protein
MNNENIRTPKEQERASLTLKLFLLFPVFGLFFWFIFQAYPEYTCSLTRNNYFLLSWPPNIASYQKIESSKYQEYEKYAYLATCSALRGIYDAQKSRT